MNDLSGLAIEREQGPSWARPNWPVAELDPINLGLDPTEATIEKVAEQAKAAVAATGVSCCGSEPVVEAASSCCSPSEVKDGLSELLGRYNVNDYAASVKVYAVK